MEEETDGQETGLAESDNPLILGTWSGLFYGAAWNGGTILILFGNGGGITMNPKAAI